jgi:hypothetical protein
VPFRDALLLLPAVSVKVAVRRSLSELRRRMARRAFATSFARRVFLVPAREPFAFAMSVFRRSPRAFASFRVTRTSTTAEHASSQVILVGIRPLLTILARLRDPSRIVPLGAVRSLASSGAAAITPVGSESDEVDRPARVAAADDVPILDSHLAASAEDRPASSVGEEHFIRRREAASEAG